MLLKKVKDLFTENIGLKAVALILALALWFYIVNELNKGTEEERQLLSKVMPSGGMVAKKLAIKPLYVGSPRDGFMVDPRKSVVVPEYCIVVGSKDMLGKIRFAHTMPVDIRGVSRSFTKSVALSPIAPGVYMEETLVQVTVPVERSQ